MPSLTGRPMGTFQGILRPRRSSSKTGGPSHALAAGAGRLEPREQVVRTTRPPQARGPPPRRGLDGREGGKAKARERVFPSRAARLVVVETEPQGTAPSPPSIPSPWAGALPAVPTQLGLDFPLRCVSLST